MTSAAAGDVLSRFTRQTAEKKVRVSIESRPTAGPDAAATADMARALRSAVDRETVLEDPGNPEGSPLHTGPSEAH